MSFVRSANIKLNRRRYELTTDTWYPLRQPYQEIRSNGIDLETTDDETHIIYFHSFTKLISGRPYTTRLELEMQLTFQFNRIPTRRQIQSVHILSAVQLVGYLIQEGCEVHENGYNPITEDLPLILYKTSALRYFEGTSIVHFVFQQIYQCIVHINPMGEL